MPKRAKEFLFVNMKPVGLINMKIEKLYDRLPFWEGSVEDINDVIEVVNTLP